MIRTDFENLKPNETYNRFIYTIYSLVNLDNGKRYIGRSRDPGKRIKDHYANLKRKKHANPFINADINCRFGYEILEENIPFEQRTEKERHYILLYETYDESKGYNANDPCIRERRSYAKGLSNRERQAMRQVSALGVWRNESPENVAENSCKQNEYNPTSVKQKTQIREF